jgi:hypothetical protein
MGSPTTPRRRDRREVVYQFLRERGERGATNRELAELLRIPSAMVHVVSLQHEGHGIERLAGQDEHGRAYTFVRLLKDAWGEEREAA